MRTSSTCLTLCSQSLYSPSSPSGNPRDGVEALCQHLGYTSEEYKTGKCVTVES